MNDELRRVLDPEDQLRRSVAASESELKQALGLALAGTSAYEAFAQKQDNELRQQLENISTAHTAAVPDTIAAWIKSTDVDVLHRSQVGLEVTEKEFWQRQERERRQKLIDQAMGQLSATNMAALSGASQSLSLVDNCDWSRISHIETKHLLGSLSGLQGYEPSHLFGSVGLSALAAVSLEESAGLSDVRHQVASMHALADIPRSNFLNQQLRLADQAEIDALALQATQADRLVSYVFGSDIGLTSLSSRMAAMHTPWIREADALSSVTSFAHLQALGDLVQNAPPFASAVSAWLRTGMGDWRDTITLPTTTYTPEARTAVYVEQGFDVDIAETETVVLIQSAAISHLYESDDGFAEDWLAAANDEIAMAELAYKRLLRFELALRSFIAKVMSELNEKWMRSRLPSGMLEQWNDKKTKAPKTDQPQELIEFADFTDYLPIIERKDNWNEVFSPIFGPRKEDIKESLQRLYPLRLAIAHARPSSVTSADLVCLWSETARIVGAFKRWEQSRASSCH